MQLLCLERTKPMTPEQHKKAKDICHQIRDEFQTQNREIDRLYERILRLLTLRPAAEWHEDFGCALWFHLPIEEPPRVGTPLDSDWTEEDDAYYSYWLPVPDQELLIPHPNQPGAVISYQLWLRLYYQEPGSDSGSGSVVLPTGEPSNQESASQ